MVGPPGPASPMRRDQPGRIAHEAWCRWAKNRPRATVEDDWFERWDDRPGLLRARPHPTAPGDGPGVLRVHVAVRRSPGRRGAPDGLPRVRGDRPGTGGRGRPDRPPCGRGRAMIRTADWIGMVAVAASGPIAATWGGPAGMVFVVSWCLAAVFVAGFEEEAPEI